MCLDSFEARLVHKTGCFHFFHLDCLANSAQYFVSVGREKLDDGRPSFIPKEGVEEDYIVCPVCRAKLGGEDRDAIRQAKAEQQREPGGSRADSGFTLPPEIREMQKAMGKLYQEQVERGGIISVEGNQRRLVVDSSTLIAVPRPSASPPPAEKKADDATAAPDASKPKPPADTKQPHRHPNGHGQQKQQQQQPPQKEKPGQPKGNPRPSPQGKKPEPPQAGKGKARAKINVEDL